MRSCAFHVASLLLVLMAVSATLGCDPHRGPAGLTKCFLATYYSKYQCGTCVTDAYMRQASKGKYQCRDKRATYCYYQCMLEKHGLDRGPVYDHCMCAADQPLPQPRVILKPECYSPDGTDCHWYRQCLHKMYDCTGQAEYAISYGEKFCNLYSQSGLKFSPKALQWIDAVRKCLQVALVPELRLCQVQPTCEDIKTKAFDSYVPCYLTSYGSLSVCSLSSSNWARIFWTVKSNFPSSAWVEPLKVFLQVAVECPGYWLQLANPVYSIDVWVSETCIGNRAAIDDELAHPIVLDMSSSLQWYQQSTVDWYAFAANTSATANSLTTPSDQPRRELKIQLFLMDRVDVGLLDVAEAAGRLRLNETITQLSDVIQHGLTGTVGNFRFGVTSLRQCASGDRINTGCSDGTVIATGSPSPPSGKVVVTCSPSPPNEKVVATCSPPVNFARFSGKFGAPKRIIAWLLASIVLLRY